MNLLSIVVEKNLDELQSLLNKQIESFKNDDIEITENIINSGPFYRLDYNVEIKSIKNYSVSDFINIFKYCVANALYEYIKLYEEPDILNKMVNYDYYYFDMNERKQIRNNIKLIMEKEKKQDQDENSESYKKKLAIIESLIHYLKINSMINLRGFITFRLKNYIIALQDMVEYGVEEFLINKEYNEFIKLLRYFVDIQEAKIDEVHILLEENNKYKLYDQYGKIIDNDYLKMIAAEMVDNEINYEDLLISSLITIAPNKIFIHRIANLKNPELIKTISRVFVNKVKICDNCDLCRVKANVEEE